MRPIMRVERVYPDAPPKKLGTIMFDPSTGTVAGDTPSVDRVARHYATRWTNQQGNELSDHTIREFTEFVRCRTNGYVRYLPL